MTVFWSDPTAIRLTLPSVTRSSTRTTSTRREHSGPSASSGSRAPASQRSRHTPSTASRTSITQLGRASVALAGSRLLARRRAAGTP